MVCHYSYLLNLGFPCSEQILCFVSVVPLQAFSVKKHVNFMGLSPVKAFQSNHIHSGRLLSFSGRVTCVWSPVFRWKGALVLFNCVLARFRPVSSFSLETFCIILQCSYCALPRKLRSAGTLCRSLAWNLRALGTWCFVLMTSFRLNLPLFPRHKGPFRKPSLHLGRGLEKSDLNIWRHWVNFYAKSTW